MDLKNSLLLMADSIAGIIGSFLKVTQTDSGEFSQGLGLGFIIVFCLNVFPKLVKKKNEITSR
ncbi:MAG: hypothetical protein JNL53_11295 [Cyclobacteriaceae bacterium]|nr:hypothetical protein [Cyclobacteriaceae bacterium]